MDFNSNKPLPPLPGESGKPDKKRNKGKKFTTKPSCHVPQISSPMNVQHALHISYDSESRRFLGMPDDMMRNLEHSGLTVAEQQKNPHAVLEVLKLYSSDLPDSEKFMTVASNPSHEATPLCNSQPFLGTPADDWCTGLSPDSGCSFPSSYGPGTRGFGHSASTPFPKTSALAAPGSHDSGGSYHGSHSSSSGGSNNSIKGIAPCKIPCVDDTGILNLNLSSSSASSGHHHLVSFTLQKSRYSDIK
ncbi:p21 protein (Cdc42 Rac)-activated kinase [Cichlidogyrus casuarinus]|uniref:P21 protein (Cdc42 Rac)-activated kinase n=1 Tax=Cichlidogyrus casuarinus TaxID=1844966 RepID=A0ABD2QP13_9PLAT